MNLAVNARVIIDHQMKDRFTNSMLAVSNSKINREKNKSKGMYWAAEKPKYVTSNDLVLSDAEYYQTKGH